MPIHFDSLTQEGVIVSDHALTDIIAIEKEIQAEIRQEQEKARNWLQSECSRVNAQSSLQLAGYKDRYRKITAKAEEQTHLEADEIINNAKRYKSLLEEITENRLTKCLRKHLPSILPETAP